MAGQLAHIPGTTGYYATDDGRIIGPRGELKQFRLKHGRFQLTIRVNGRMVTKKTHQWVMLAFVGPPPQGQQINHLDYDPSNNRLDNLEYTTDSENKHHAFRHGRVRMRGERHGMCRLTPEAVLEIKRCVGLQKHIAAFYGVTRQTIGDIKKGRRWGWQAA